MSHTGISTWFDSPFTESTFFSCRFSIFFHLMKIIKEFESSAMERFWMTTCFLTFLRAKFSIWRKKQPRTECLVHCSEISSLNSAFQDSSASQRIWGCTRPVLQSFRSITDNLSNLAESVKVQKSVSSKCAQSVRGPLTSAPSPPRHSITDRFVIEWLRRRTASLSGSKLHLITDYPFQFRQNSDR